MGELKKELKKKEQKREKPADKKAKGTVKNSRKEHRSDAGEKKVKGGLLRMNLCEKCGSLMLPKKENNRVSFVCRNCGSKKTAGKNDDFRLREKMDKDPMDRIPVLSEGTDALPKMKILCPECGNGTAAAWSRQTRSSDEPETRFYCCTKCKHTWREYS